MIEKDEALVLIYLEDGKEEAITTLIARYTSPIYSFIRRLVGDGEEAEDLTQETFVKMWRSLSSFDATKSFRAWLFTIARRTAIDYLRKKKPTVFSRLSNDTEKFEDTLEDEAALQDEVFEKRETREALDKVLEKLSIDERTIIVLHHSDDLTFEEIGAVFGESMNTVKSRYRRALQKMRTMLAAPNGT